MSCILETPSNEAFFSDSLQILADFIPSEKKSSLQKRNLYANSAPKSSILYRHAQGSREKLELSYSFPLLPL